MASVLDRTAWAPTPSLCVSGPFCHFTQELEFGDFLDQLILTVTVQSQPRSLGYPTETGPNPLALEQVQSGLPSGFLT